MTNIIPPKMHTSRTRRARAAAALAAAAVVAIGVPAVTGAAQAAPDPVVSLRRATTPVAPANLRLAEATTSSATVNWDAVPGATLYRLEYADNSGMTGYLTKWTSGTTLTLADLPANTSRWVRVRVARVDGKLKAGVWSPAIEARTLKPVPPTAFGANYTTNNMVDEGIYGGRASAARVFFQQLDGVSFANNSSVKEAMADGVRTFVISWKETNLTAVKTFLAGIPDGLKVYTTFNHEPEDDNGNPGSSTYKAWSQEYKHQWSLQSPLMRAEGFIPTNILMAWTLNPKSGRDVSDWTPPAGTVDVFAFDAYYGKGKDPATLVARIEEATAAAGLTKTGLGETGAPADDPDRVANTKEMRASVLDAGNFAFGLYWNSAEGSGYDSRMDRATADAWFGA
jgi:hypothetical protein